MIRMDDGLIFRLRSAFCESGVGNWTEKSKLLSQLQRRKNQQSSINRVLPKLLSFTVILLHRVRTVSFLYQSSTKKTQSNQIIQIASRKRQDI